MERRIPLRTLRAARGSSMLDALAATTAWEDVGGTFVRVLGVLAGTPFVAMPERAVVRAPVFVADVSLSRPDLELSLSIVIEPTSMRSLARRVLDSEDVADAESLVLEAANILMGTLRASLAAEGVCLALGLPEVGTRAGSRRRFDDAPLRAGLAAVSAAGAFELWLSATPVSASLDG